MDSLEQDKKNEIIWKAGNKLNWNNFQGVPDSLSLNDAITSSGIHFSAIEQDLYINFEFSSYFDRLKSWSKNKSSMTLLAHEQLQFDMTELAARKIRKECSEAKFDDKYFNEAMDLVDHIYDVNCEIKNNMNKEYDWETNHGTIIEKQLEWQKKIALELKALNKYASPKIIKRFKK